MLEKHEDTCTKPYGDKHRDKACGVCRTLLCMWRQHVKSMCPHAISPHDYLPMVEACVLMLFSHMSSSTWLKCPSSRFFCMCPAHPRWDVFHELRP